MAAPQQDQTGNNHDERPKVSVAQDGSSVRIDLPPYSVMSENPEIIRALTQAKALMQLGTIREKVYSEHFLKTDFTETSFTETSFTETSFTETSFTETSFTETSFTETSFTETGFTETAEGYRLTLDFLHDSDDAEKFNAEKFIGHLRDTLKEQGYILVQIQENPSSVRKEQDSPQPEGGAAQQSPLGDDGVAPSFL